MKRKALAIVCTAAMAVTGTFLLNAANSPTKAAAPAPFTPSQHFAGYATGTDVFADALKNLQPGVELANANIGYSAAAANSDGLLGTYVPAAQNGGAAFPATGKGIVNEMSHSVVPPVEATFGNTPTDPFPGDPAGTFPVEPTGANASGGAANTDTTKALGWGMGNAAQVELLNTAMGPLAAKLGDPKSQPLVATTGGQPTNRQVSTAKS